MGKFNILATIFCFVLFCLPDLYCGTFHDKKINLKIELVDKDLLLSHEHLKKEKNIVQNGKKIKIKIFEKIKENVLERALVVQEVDKIKGLSESKRGSAASLQNLSGDAGDDGADRTDDNGDDSANDNDDDDNGNDAASAGGEHAGSEEEIPAHDASDMKVISTEESTENDVHMLRKVYQKKSDEESTTYCYMRYTFNLNLDKLSENNKSELFKGLDKSLDYMSFLPKEDQVSDTEEILDHEYKQLDKSTESNDSILSSVELRNGNFNLNSCPNSEYAETIDDIVSYLESASSRFIIPSSIKNKLLSERDLLKGCDEVEAGDASSTDNAPDANAEKFALYEILTNLKDSFMMKKKVINLLRNGSTNAEDANSDRVAEKDLDEIFIDSVEQTFDCYEVLKGSQRLDSILASEEGKTLVEESPNTKEVDIKIHDFRYAPGETSEENSLASGDDKDKCEVFFRAILQSEVFADDSTFSRNYVSTKLSSAFMGDDSQMGVTASERDTPKEDTSNWQESQKVFADTASFVDTSTGMISYEMDDEGEEVDADEVEVDEEEDYNEDDCKKECNMECNGECDREYDGEDIRECYTECDMECGKECDMDGDDDEDDDDDEEYGDDNDGDDDEKQGEKFREKFCAEPDLSSLGMKDLLGNLLKKGSEHLIDKATNKVSSVIGENFNMDELSKKANKMVGKIKEASKKGSMKYKEAKKGVKKFLTKAKLVSKKNVDKLKKEAKSGFENLKDVGMDGFRKLKDAAKREGKRLKREGKEFVDKAVHVGKDAIDKVKKVTKKGIDKGEKKVKKMKKVVKKGIDKAEEVAKKGMDMAEEVAKKGMDIAQEVAKAGVKKVKKGIDKAEKVAKKGMERHE
ncbi:hypothetical protein PCYB_111270 [Plasmodium cynomolgi strain B]|uniref:Secreted ookinete protein n=1 Tax=Plasmodium cynomolgi (strain B) TaxID=1120755 RepID=K6UDS4_PLACD|nr:hypothetical protein PCYB_111270 [Plasmodium cynomolgi strain B]GAB67106.1 hypothetical protein PCYB_111270 [Plasmodium cynomolgi strain B]